MKKTTADEQITEFKGYTIDELRYQRAYALAKYEVAKMRMADDVQRLKSGMPQIGPKGIVGKLLRSLNYVDYAVIGFRLFSHLKKWKKVKS